MRRNVGVLLLAGWGVAAGGCNQAARLGQGTAADQTSLFEGQAAVTALERLRQAAGGPKLQCLEVSVYADRAELQYQDPSQPENADAYRYERGLTRGPIPVKLVGGGRLADSVFPLAQVELERLPALFTEALRRADLEGGRVEQLRIRREFSPLSPATRRVLQEAARRGSASHGLVEDFPDGAVVLQVSVSGTRRNATVRADARGRIVMVKVI